MCPYLITKVCGINLGLKRRKSLNRRDCIKISVDKERSPPAPVGPSAPCYCLYVSPLITAPLDQVGWLTMGKRRALTFLKSWTHTSTRTHALTCTHSQPGNGNHKKSPRGEQHATRFKAASVSNNQTDDRHQPQPEVRDAAVTRPPPSFKLLMQWGPSHHYTSTQYTPTHTQKHLNSDVSSRADEIRLFSIWINQLIISHFIIKSIKCGKNGC